MEFKKPKTLALIGSEEIIKEATEILTKDKNFITISIEESKRIKEMIIVKLIKEIV